MKSSHNWKRTAFRTISGPERKKTALMKSTPWPQIMIASRESTYRSSNKSEQGRCGLYPWPLTTQGKKSLMVTIEEEDRHREKEARLVPQTSLSVCLGKGKNILQKISKNILTFITIFNCNLYTSLNSLKGTLLKPFLNIERARWILVLRLLT